MEESRVIESGETNTGNENFMNNSKDSSEESTSSSIEDLQKHVQELENQVKEKENKYLYLYAEFENFKKRSFKERSDMLKFACEPLAHELLQVVDNLERALSHAPPETEKS